MTLRRDANKIRRTVDDDIDKLFQIILVFFRHVGRKDCLSGSEDKIINFIVTEVILNIVSASNKQKNQSRFLFV